MKEKALGFVLSQADYYETLRLRVLRFRLGVFVFSKLMNLCTYVLEWTRTCE